jgi:membrane-bound serine protease (ClpP class)
VEVPPGSHQEGEVPRRRVTQLWAVLFVLGLLTLGSMALSRTAHASGPNTDAVLTTRVDGAITPVIADHLVESVRVAERADYQAYLVELDTPGGLEDSMRKIIRSFLGARVPVVVYVTPTGARAASAGTLITLSANVAAMAPGTSIGAATPVDLQGGETSQKVINYAAAYARSVAIQRGRNADFAEDAVRKGRAITAGDAVRLHVVDLIAANRGDLFAAIDGRTVQVGDGRAVTLHTRGARVVRRDLGALRSLLQLLADPNLAFLFLSLGTLAIIFELAHPGALISGTVGVILLLLAFVSLSVLPFTVAGVALLLLGAGFFAAELYAPGTAVFAVAGAICMLMAGVLLFQGPFGVDPGVLWPTVLVVAGGAIIAGRLAWRARRRTPISGRELLIGRQTAVRRADGATGRVLLEGAWWNVRSGDGPLHAGQVVQVTGMDGLDLLVEPMNPPEEATHE